MQPKSRARGTMLACLWLSTGVLRAAAPARAEEPAASPGEALYQARCASCHDGGAARAPDRTALRQLAPERIGFALAYGLMSQQGRDLSRSQIGELVRY